jgi:hypothetical protein
MSNDIKNRRKYILLWAVLLIAGLIVWLAFLLTGADTARAWRALLINFAFFGSLAAGLVTWSAAVVASNGSWPGKAEQLAWTGYGFILPSIIILVALWIGSPHWAPWYKTRLHQGFWLNNDFLFLRDLGSLIIFWAAGLWYLHWRRKGRKRSQLQAGILAVIYSIAFSLLGFDLVMAPDPRWYSAAFGAYFFISGLYVGICFWSILVALRPEVGPDIRHDLGKLVLAFSILTTYFFFIQLLTIWYENLPNEIPFFVKRLNFRDWRDITFLLIVFVYVGPLIMLLTTGAKRNRYALGIICLIILIGLWFERWWLISPRFMPVELGWMELSGTAAVLGALGLSIQLVEKKLPDIPPEEGVEEGGA